MRRHPFLSGFAFIFCLCFVFIIILFLLERAGVIRDMGVGEDKIAVLEIEGIITKSRAIIDTLNKYKQNDMIKAVIIRIDSPGGGVGPSQEIYEEVMKLREKKQIVASMGSVAASGGYYIACAANKIIANPGTITGSIGVIIEFANIEELFSKIGMKSVVIKSGKYKDILSPTRQMQDEEKNLIQGVIDNILSQFIDAIAKGRNLPRENIAEIADGRIFSGEQAKELGLVDELGNLQDAIDHAAKLAGIEGEPHVIYPEKKKPSIWEFLLEGTLSRLSETLSKNVFQANYLLTTQ